MGAARGVPARGGVADPAQDLRQPVAGSIRTTRAAAPRASDPDRDRPAGLAPRARNHGNDIIADKARALYILRQIKSLGVTVALDDFGTGYSSLDTLRSFPFDKIKLDRVFMSEVETNPQSRAIVRAVLALGKSLEVPILAEGVETDNQLDLLRREGCDEAQGFLLGRPGPHEEIMQYDDVFTLFEANLVTAPSRETA